jgi:hypothetical protein
MAATRNPSVEAARERNNAFYREKGNIVSEYLRHSKASGHQVRSGLAQLLDN